MTKEQIMIEARKAFAAGIRMINDNDRDGFELARRYWKKRESLCCHNKQEHYWWETGFLYRNEKDRAEFEAWNEQYWKIAHALKGAGLSEKDSNEILWIWNDRYCKRHYGNLAFGKSSIFRSLD